jgi:hypothetical protein
VADARALGHAQEQRAPPGIFDPRGGPVDKGAVNIVAGDGGADGVEKGGWQVAAPVDWLAR